MIAFVLVCPTPHNAPVLDRLYDKLGEQLRMFYVFDADPGRGWGQLTMTHPYVVLDHRRGWTALAKTLLSPELEAVCIYGYRDAPMVLSAMAARLRHVPLVLRGDANAAIELSRPAPRRLAKRWLLRALLGQPEVWTNGSANTAYWRLLGLRRLHAIPNALPHLPGNESGVAALRDQLSLADRFVFTFVGRLKPVKGVADLLQAYDLVREATPQAATALVIVGQGVLEPDVRQYVDARDDCHYLGAIPQDRLGAVYAAADAVVIPSHSETWCWVVNEALGFGTRVIVTTGVAAADDLCTEVTGRRCPPADPPALAAAMLAEYEGGHRRAPRLECVDTARVMAERLHELTRGAVRSSDGAGTG